MTREVLKMALEAGYKDLPTVRLAYQGFDIQHFTNLVIAAERHRVLADEREALAQPEMRKATREEKISNPGVYEVPVQPEQPDTIALIKECQTALAEELAACDIDPPLHHILQAHDKCVAWLVGAGVLVYCTACERNVKGPCNSVECSTPEPTPQPVQIGDKT